MPSRSPLLALAALALAAACSRSLPAAEPSGSPASPRAAAAPVAVVGRSLLEEPPLPGERREGWEALEQDQGGEAPHEGHGHHGHHGH